MNPPFDYYTDWQDLVQQARPDLLVNDTYKKILYAQYVLETADGTSNLAVNHLNLFGMGIASTRDQAQFIIGSHPTFEGARARYKSAADSYADRVHLDEFNAAPIPVADFQLVNYMQFVLSAGYATDPDYFFKWGVVYAREFGDIPNQPEINHAAQSGGALPKVRGSIWKILLLGAGAAYLFSPKVRKFINGSFKKALGR